MSHIIQQFQSKSKKVIIQGIAEKLLQIHQNYRDLVPNDKFSFFNYISQ